MRGAGVRGAVLAVLLTGGAALAEGPVADPHVMLPRSEAEAARVASAVAPDPSGRVQPFEDRPGGAATVAARTGADAFSQPVPGLSPEEVMDFRLGNALFRKLWIAAPASTRGSDGLGPLWNARSCADCHRNDGRGFPPEEAGDRRPGAVLRLAVPGGAGQEAIADWLAAGPDPVYGAQLQDRAASGLVAEGRLTVEWREVPVALPDGTTVTLRAPEARVADPAFGPLSEGTVTSMRVAPQMIGLGLLEAIPAADILALADPEDADGDGISGRAQVVPAAESGLPMLGRFGWKAAVPSLREQAAGAFHLDMGLSSPLHPDAAGDCTAAQADCRTAPHGEDAGLRDGREVDGAALDLVAFYSGALAVPARRGLDRAEVARGKALFHQAGCPACHVPALVTGRMPDRPAWSFQLVWPYTDLLLHDMGPGLADALPQGRASGAEWRTAPLWGLGLTEQVSGRPGFLHDGRARDLTEAVLWHGGEAQTARDAFAAFPAADRAALIAFLESL